MIVNSRAWYVKWFQNSCWALDKFLPQAPSKRIKYENQTSLCTFFHILFWGTVVQILSVVTWIALVFSIFIMPWIMFPPMTVLTSVGVMLAFVVVIVALLAFCVGAKEVSDWCQTKIEQVKNPDPDKPVSFLSVVVNYVSGIKNKFCPMINFKKDE